MWDERPSSSKYCNYNWWYLLLYYYGGISLLQSAHDDCDMQHKSSQLGSVVSCPPHFHYDLLQLLFTTLYLFMPSFHNAAINRPKWSCVDRQPLEEKMHTHGDRRPPAPANMKPGCWSSSSHCSSLLTAMATHTCVHVIGPDQTTQPDI